MNQVAPSCRVAAHAKTLCKQDRPVLARYKSFFGEYHQAFSSLTDTIMTIKSRKDLTPNYCYYTLPREHSQSHCQGRSKCFMRFQRQSLNRCCSINSLQPCSPLSCFLLVIMVPWPRQKHAEILCPFGVCWILHDLYPLKQPNCM